MALKMDLCFLSYNRIYSSIRQDLYGCDLKVNFSMIFVVTTATAATA